jgi:hypothetical protein
MRFEEQSHPDEVEGTKYIVTHPYGVNGYKLGDIVTLYYNDHSCAPYFTTSDDSEICIAWDELSTHKEPTESKNDPVQDTSDYDQLSLENHNLKQEIKKLEDYILRSARV